MFHSSRILLFLISFIVYGTAHAQLPVDSFYTKGTVAYSADYINAGFGSYWYKKYKFTVGDDTLIKNKIYRTITGSTHLDSPKLMGGIRVSNDSVFFYKLDRLFGTWSGDPSHMLTYQSLPDTTEVLLYDYNIQLGDTLNWLQDYGYSIYNKKADEIVVINVDSIQMYSGGYVTRYVFKNDSNGVPCDYWLKGIGSSAGFFASYLTSENVCTNDAYASCYFSHNASYLFKGPASNCFLTGIEVKHSEQTNMSVFPNPTIEDHVTLKTNVDIAMVHVYDMCGKLVNTIFHKQKGNVSINLPAVPGLYYISVLDGNGKRSSHKVEKL